MKAVAGRNRKSAGQLIGENLSIIAVLFLMILGTAAYGTTFLNGSVK